jgi:hypothetical protein
VLRIAVNQSRNREVRGRACMALVKLLEAREVIALSHAYDEGGKPVLPPLIAKRIDAIEKVASAYADTTMVTQRSPA